MLVYQFLVFALLTSITNTEVQNSTTNPSLHESLSDLQIISTQKTLDPKLNLFNSRDFDKSLVLPTFKFDYAAIRPVPFENIQRNFTRVKGYYGNTQQDVPTKDEITKFHKDLADIKIDDWVKLGAPSFKLPEFKINGGYKINTEHINVGSFSKLKYGGIGAGLAGLAGSFVACCKFCGIKSKTNSDSLSHSHGEEHFLTDHIFIEIPEDNRAGQ